MDPVKKAKAGKKTPFNLRSLAYLEGVTVIVWGAFIVFCVYSFTDGFSTFLADKESQLLGLSAASPLPLLPPYGAIPH
jgi:hypothetical protein